jgi:hypothetical protein
MMRLASRLILRISFPCIALLAFPCGILSQESVSAPVVVAGAADLPEAPMPQFTSTDQSADQEPAAQQTPASQTQTTPQPAPATSQTQTPAQGSSSSQTPAQQTDGAKSSHDKAEEQLKAQEKQRVMGVMAAFNTTSNKDALPLSSGQKFKLFFRSETDPWPFLLAGVVSGVGMADDSYPTWGQGVQGYAKRFGAAYTDAFIGNFFGNAVLTSLLREDPRYFQKGTGKPIKRFLWAAASTVWCRRDSGKWGPNYANVIGNLVGSAISNVYYPASEHTVSNTINDGLTVSAEGIVGAEVIEFWPDLVRHHKRKQAEKLAAQQAKDEAKQNQDQKQK